MSDYVVNKTEERVEKEIRELNAAGEYSASLSTIRNYLDYLASVSRARHFQNPAATYQYMIALSRIGKFEEAMAIRWRDMAVWSGFTPERLGDWYRDGHARYFLSLGDFMAAEGAVIEALKFHPEGTSRHLLDKLVLALIPVVQNRPVTAQDRIEAIIAKLDVVEPERRYEFESVERLAKWWLLLLKCANGETDGVAALGVWVAAHDISKRRQEQAIMLANSHHAKRDALRAISKEIKGR